MGLSNLKLDLTYGQLIQFNIVKPQFQLAQSPVAVSLDLVNHGAHSAKQAAHVKCRPFQQFGPRLTLRVFYVFHK